jgi:hypothetical protein
MRGAGIGALPLVPGREAAERSIRRAPLSRHAVTPAIASAPTAQYAAARFPLQLPMRFRLANLAETDPQETAVAISEVAAMRDSASRIAVWA